MENNSKILMVGPDSQGGISSVIKYYRNNNLDVINLASYKNNNIFLRLIIYISFILKYFWILCTNKNIKLIHIHSASYGSFLRKSFVLNIAKLFRKKVIFHIHGGEFNLFYSKSSIFIKQKITNTLNKADAIIVLSRQWKDKISNISSNNNIKILYNPTTIKELNQNSSENIGILFMGRLGKGKGVYEIIEAAKHVQNPNIVINLYGDGNLEEFKKLVTDNNLQEKVKIKGWVSGSAKDEAYKNSNIYILPSYNEGLPMAILEAMAYGLPIISTPVGGISEAVEEGVNGFLIQPGDYKALSEKINLLANDKELRAQMGQAGYKIAKEKFDIKIIIRQLQEIYDELLK